MDNRKISNNHLSELLDLIESLHVEMPLFHNNPNCAIKFDFEDTSDRIAKEIVLKILNELFHDCYFWVCEYGCSSADTFLKHLFFKNSAPPVIVFPYQFKYVDHDYFEYAHDTIACVRTGDNNFCFDSYVEYAFRLEFISNTIFLMDTNQGIAVHLYDRRGMDVATQNHDVLIHLFHSYEAYVSKYFKDLICNAIDITNE